MVVHSGKKLPLDGVFRDGTDDCVDTATRAKRSVAVIGPVLNLVRRERCKTVKAATEIALQEVGAVTDRPFVSSNRIFRPR